MFQNRQGGVGASVSVSLVTEVLGESGAKRRGQRDQRGQMR